MLKHIPMTPAQAARTNANAARADEWLAPFQLDLKAAIEKDPSKDWPVVIGKSLEEGLAAVEAVRAPH